MKMNFSNSREPLIRYNSLMDPHLATYFTNPRIRRHLRNIGLILPNGEAVTEETFRLYVGKLHRRDQTKQLLMEAIARESLHLNHSRVAAINRWMEELQKLALVNRIREEEWRGIGSAPRSCMSHRTSSQLSQLPLVLFNPKAESLSSKRRGRAHKTRREKETLERSSRRSQSAGKSRATRTQDNQAFSSRISSSMSNGSRSDEEDDDAQQKSFSSGSSFTSSTSSLSSSLSSSSSSSSSSSLSSDDNKTDDESLLDSSRQISSSSSQRNVDSRSVKKESNHIPDKHDNRNHLFASRESFKDEADGLTVFPHPPKGESSHTQVKNYSARRKQFELSKQTFKQGYPMPLALQKLSRLQHNGSHVTLHFFGTALELHNEMMTNCSDVSVEQQHCGGNTVVVFRGQVPAKSDFAFYSYRRKGYPFSVTIYVDGHQDSRLSTCCEYKHLPGARLGGLTGHFGMVGVKGGKPCYRCLLNGTRAEADQKESLKGLQETHKEYKGHSISGKREETNSSSSTDFYDKSSNKQDYEIKRNEQEHTEKQWVKKKTQKKKDKIIKIKVEVDVKRKTEKHKKLLQNSDDDEDEESNEAIENEQKEKSHDDRKLSEDLNKKQNMAKKLEASESEKEENKENGSSKYKKADKTGSSALLRMDKGDRKLTGATEKDHSKFIPKNTYKKPNNHGYNSQKSDDNSSNESQNTEIQEEAMHMTASGSERNDKYRETEAVEKIITGTKRSQNETNSDEQLEEMTSSTVRSARSKGIDDSELEERPPTSPVAKRSLKDEDSEQEEEMTSSTVHDARSSDADESEQREQMSPLLPDTKRRHKEIDSGLVEEAIPSALSRRSSTKEYDDSLKLPKICSTSVEGVDNLKIGNADTDDDSDSDFKDIGSKKEETSHAQGNVSTTVAQVYTPDEKSPFMKQDLSVDIRILHDNNSPSSFDKYELQRSSGSSEEGNEDQILTREVLQKERESKVHKSY